MEANPKTTNPPEQVKAADEGKGWTKGPISEVNDVRLNIGGAGNFLRDEDARLSVLVNSTNPDLEHKFTRLIAAAPDGYELVEQLEDMLIHGHYELLEKRLAMLARIAAYKQRARGGQ